MLPDLNSYDHFIVAFSGGKDSVACLLYLLELGVPKSKIECWHHEVDGRESPLLFDWPITTSYVKTVCDALDIPLFYSWKKGGLEAEMLRENAPTSATMFETPEGLKSAGGNSDSLGTRLRFPQISADLSVRFCSAYSKVMVCSAAINNQERFKGKRTLVISGERRIESKARSLYNEFEIYRKKRVQIRHVDHWRPVIDWDDSQVWDIAERWSILSHPCYYLGFGRASCMMCIFNSDNHLATLYKIAPERVQKFVDYENQFADYWHQQNPTAKRYTLHRTYSIMERVQRGTPFEMKDEHIKLALSHDYYQDVVTLPGEWELPKGAFSSDQSGPT